MTTKQKIMKNAKTLKNLSGVDKLELQIKQIRLLDSIDWDLSVKDTQMGLF